MTHRSFIGYTRERLDPPEIDLNDQGKADSIDLGFTEIKRLLKEAPEGTGLVDPPITISARFNLEVQL